MEIKNGYPVNLNLIEKITFGQTDSLNRINRSSWTNSLGEQYNRIVGASIWPYKTGKTKRKYFAEDCNKLSGKRLLFILKGAIREIPFIATVKSHWGSVIEILHTDGSEEKINIRDPKFDDLLTIKCLDAY